MSHRNLLLQWLADYSPSEEEQESYAKILRFVSEELQCFERTCIPGHITGSAWILDSSGDRALLTHHKKLGLWLQLGGHADGDSDVRSVALREAREESGIEAIEFVRPGIFDVDVHWIPERRTDPGHYHYDVRFLLRVSDPTAELQVSEESHALRWITAPELAGLEVDQSVRRMARKWADLMA